MMSTSSRSAERPSASGLAASGFEDGRRYDLGARYGLLTAQLALALNGQDRAQVLSQLVELLADREMAAANGDASKKGLSR